MAIIDYNSAIQNTINEEMRRDPNLLILGPSVIGEPSIAEFGKNRVINTGISETAACAAGIGAAMVGGRPIVDTMWAPGATRSGFTKPSRVGPAEENGAI